MNDGQANLIRSEALEHAAMLRQRPGDVLRISPSWTQWTYWVLLAVFVAGILFALFGTVSEYAEGPAVVWEERTPVMAETSGIVKDVHARVGASVVPGQQMVTFRDPSRPGQFNWIRAPRRGIVGEIHIRPGQHFTPGETLLSLVENDLDSHMSVIAMVPAHHRPMLDDGQLLCLEMAGYPNAKQTVIVDRVENEAIGPGTVGRYLGAKVADTVPVRGPVVLVHARLHSERFTARSRRLQYYHGMQGTAAIRVRTERIIYFLGRALFGDADG